MDAVTAVMSSANAVLRNKPAMLVWALCIVCGAAASIATRLTGFALIAPWLGYATWHAYRRVMEVSRWPA